MNELLNLYEVQTLDEARSVLDGPLTYYESRSVLDGPLTSCNKGVQARTTRCNLDQQLTAIGLLNTSVMFVLYLLSIYGCCTINCLSGTIKMFLMSLKCTNCCRFEGINVILTELQLLFCTAGFLSFFLCQWSRPISSGANSKLGLLILGCELWS